MKRAERRLAKRAGGEPKSDVGKWALAYSIALQRAIEIHCAGEAVPEEIARECPWHAHKLNRDLVERAAFSFNQTTPRKPRPNHSIWCKGWDCEELCDCGALEARAEAPSTAVRDVDHSAGQGDSKSNSETSAASAAFSVRAVKDHP